MSTQLSATPECDKNLLRLNFLIGSSQPRFVEEHKGMFRVYEDISRDGDEHRRWAAITLNYWPTATQAIDEAMAVYKE